MALRKSHRFVVNPAAPWEGDPFDRQAHGERLLRLVQTMQEQAYVIAINGDWGTGKSVFLQRLEKHFERAAPAVPFIRIDAWAADDSDDPLVPFVAALHGRINATQGRSKRIRDNLVKAATKLTVPVAALTANVAAPGAADAIAAAAEFGRTLINWEIERHTAATEFQRALVSARDLLTRRSSDRAITRPIVIAIDELDRCRPDYSIKALERIKHFFDVPGIVFLIATDRGNLPAAVKSVYGDAINGELYLRKFFDYEYRLPRPTAEAYVQVLWREYEMDTVLKETLDPQQAGVAFHSGNNYSPLLTQHRNSLDAYEYKHYFAYFSALFELSLRDQSQAFTMLSAHVRTTPASLIRLPLVDCFIVCLRFFDLKSYEQAQAGSLSLSSVSNTAPESVRNAFAKLQATQDGRLLGWYFSHQTIDQMLDMVQTGRSRAKSENRWEDVPRLERMEARLSRNRQDSPAYLEALVGLIYTFTPDP